MLPDHFSKDPARRERFEREAKAISRLNHPHICTLHDVGSEDGTDYLVMEYIEGETLADRLKRGPLPFQEAIRFGIQIADAMDNAHSHGVVHRDLKPANIMLTPSGPKLLDFGIAKALSGETSETNSEGPTKVKSLTEEGAVLGTPQYMSPEQLQGEEADARTDIFSFGVVLYEMVTARKAFEGATPASLIAAILEHEPPTFSELEPPAPTLLNKVLLTCLRKDPEDRFQSAKDLRLSLGWIHGDKEPIETAQFRRSLLWPVLVCALALALATSVVFRSERVAEIRKFAVMPPPGHNFQGFQFERKSFSISPDGSRLAFVAKDESDGQVRLWIRELLGSSMRRVDGTERATFPFWAPSGDYVGFFADGKIKRVSADDGLAETVSDLPGQARGGSWNADGVILAALGGDTIIQRLDASDGGPRSATNLEEGESEHFFPQFLPDGKHYLFFVRSVKEGARGVYLGNLGETSHRLLLPSESSAIYVAPGYLLFQRDGGLRAQRFDARTLSLSGDVVSLPYEVEVTRFNHLAASVSANGTMVYSSGGLRQQLTWYSRDGRALGPLGPPGQHYTFRISPDGSQVAISRVQQQGDLWLIDAAGSVPVRLTSSLANDVNGIWSDDGQELFFSSQRGGSPELYRIRAFGGNEPELVFPNSGTVLDVVEPESAIVVGFRRLRTFHLDGAWEPRLVADNTSVSQWLSLVSPNAKWIAYWARESGRDEVYVTSFPEPGRRWAVSTGGGLRPRWTADGNELFYIGTDGFLYTVPVDTGVTFSSGEPVALFDLDGAVSYDVAPDGRILVNVPLPEPPELNVVMDWTTALPR